MTARPDGMAAASGSEASQWPSMRTKLREIAEQLMATRHDGIDGQGKGLAQILRGWMAYYAVPMGGSAITAFWHHMIERWHGALMRCSQQRRLTWTRMKTIP